MTFPPDQLPIKGVALRVDGCIYSLNPPFKGFNRIEICYTSCRLFICKDYRFVYMPLPAYYHLGGVGFGKEAGSQQERRVLFHLGYVPFITGGP